MGGRRRGAWARPGRRPRTRRLDSGRRCRPEALSNTQALQEPGDSTAQELLLCGVWTETSHRDRGARGPEKLMPRGPCGSPAPPPGAPCTERWRSAPAGPPRTVPPRRRFLRLLLKNQSFFSTQFNRKMKTKYSF